MVLTKLSKLQALRSSKSALLPKPLRLPLMESVSVADPNWGTHLVQDILQLLPNSYLIEANVLQLHQQSSAQTDWDSRSLLLFRVLHDWDHFVRQTPDTARPREQVDSTMDTPIASTRESFDLLGHTGTSSWPFGVGVSSIGWMQTEGRDDHHPRSVSSHNGFAQLRKFASCFQDHSRSFKCAIAKSSCSNALVWAP